MPIVLILDSTIAPNMEPLAHSFSDGRLEASWKLFFQLRESTGFSIPTEPGLVQQSFSI